MAKQKKATKSDEPKRARKAFTLTDEAGNRLMLVASEQKDGTFRSAVVHRLDGKSKRGMAMTHATFDGALERAKALAVQAGQAGWKAKERKTKAPAFTEIPTPAASTVSTATTKTRPRANA